MKEAQLFQTEKDSYGIYQIREGTDSEPFKFRGKDYLERKGIAMQPFDFDMVYAGELQGQTLDDLFEKFNMDHPKDFKGHSMSVSDVIVIKKAGQMQAYYVDIFGFTKVSGFCEAREQIGPQKKPDKEHMLTYESGICGDVQVKLEIAQYWNNGGMYIGLVAYDEEGMSEPYADLTVNLHVKAPDYCAYLDTNNLGDAEEFIKKNGLGEFTGFIGKSGKCEYPLYMFHADKLRELCPEQMAVYEAKIASKTQHTERKTDKKEKGR